MHVPCSIGFRPTFGFFNNKYPNVKNIRMFVIFGRGGFSLLFGYNLNNKGRSQQSNKNKHFVYILYICAISIFIYIVTKYLTLAVIVCDDPNDYKSDRG